MVEAAVGIAADILAEIAAAAEAEAVVGIAAAAEAVDFAAEAPALKKWGREGGIRLLYLMSFALRGCINTK